MLSIVKEFILTSTKYIYNDTKLAPCSKQNKFNPRYIYAVAEAIILLLYIIFVLLLPIGVCFVMGLCFCGVVDFCDHLADAERVHCFSSWCHVAVSQCCVSFLLGTGDLAFGIL